MKIKELSETLKISKDAIRLYERMGLLIDITQPHKENSYKEYGVSNIERINVIKYSQSLGFSLKECKHIIDSLMDGTLNQAEKQELIELKMKEIDQKILSLKKTRTLLEEALKKTCEQ
ncbi:MerR family transcriptional regulator [Flexithrix dorotheae]|uniref:MerR family transcriptional regulator n=1 Tax=Flexithrix dorotheae TaxID=70993 RepID=UPI0005C6FED3|nr:MerR family transcriptional regulator [Flexithrix dorotheae]